MKVRSNRFKLLCQSSLTLIGTAVILLFFAAVSRTMPETVSVGGRTAVELPIIMYHSVLRDPARAGMYVVSPETLRADLVYLIDNGYTAVWLSDVIAYVHYGVPLPEKSVVITFDDGYMNNLEYVLPLLDELDMKAVVSVVGEYTDTYTQSGDRNPNYSYLFWEDIAALEASGRFEIQNHSYSLHRNDGIRQGASRKRGESEADYRRILTDDAEHLQSRLAEVCVNVPSVFTYPFGFISECSDKILRNAGFAATLSCYEHTNTVSDAESLFSLGRFNRPSGVSTEQFMSEVLP